MYRGWSVLFCFTFFTKTPFLILNARFIQPRSLEYSGIGELGCVPRFKLNGDNTTTCDGRLYELIESVLESLIDAEVIACRSGISLGEFVDCIAIKLVRRDMDLVVAGDVLQGGDA